MGRYDFYCPYCSAGVDGGDIPDHVHGATRGDGTFEYECECERTFKVRVECDPSFYVEPPMDPDVLREARDEYRKLRDELPDAPE